MEVYTVKIYINEEVTLAAEDREQATRLALLDASVRAKRSGTVTTRLVPDTTTLSILDDETR